MIRVWGGGIYPDDWFYELCDQMGLLVWQDCMFACSAYKADEEFCDTVRAEIADNAKRIRCRQIRPPMTETSTNKTFRDRIL